MTRKPPRIPGRFTVAVTRNRPGSTSYRDGRDVRNRNHSSKHMTPEFQRHLHHPSLLLNACDNRPNTTTACYQSLFGRKASNQIFTMVLLSSHSPALSTVILLLCLLPNSLATTSIRVELTHVDSLANLTTTELLRRAVQRSQHRISSLTAQAKLAASLPANPVHPGNGEYLVVLFIGTPPQEFLAIVDTGSDLVWAQCDPCIECYNQLSAKFNSSISSTFSKLPCSSKLCQTLQLHGCNQSCLYEYWYLDYSYTKGFLAAETFYLGYNPVHNIGFGCGKSNDGAGFSQAGGILGLGRGPLSLISQMNLKKFSYCLTSFGRPDGLSLLVFGSPPNLDGTERHTAMIQNPSMPSSYYVNLKGITVGETLVPIGSSTFELNEDGTGGMIIDSGTSYTALEETGYELVKQAFSSQVNLPSVDGSDFGFDLCFQLSSNSSSFKAPKLVFHFDGADLDLPQENYFVVQDPVSGVVCLMLMSNTGLSVLGNFQQQNILVVYDLESEQLLFRTAQCDQM
uniref:Aspartic proteinase nepenthesin-1-like n=2 Tax=Elaeis guineensis var. tenera TaxID=51953 RepID=A0A6I9QEG8_ELAGV|nr:aspartic proteinase nepenthesin-1-like [Elaeis guineensis]